MSIHCLAHPIYRIYSLLSRINERLSNLTICNSFWRPSQQPQRTKQLSDDDLIPAVKPDINKPTKTSIARTVSENRVGANIIPDKLEMEKATAENDLAAKKSIESCAEFKLLFVPGYEVGEPDEFYEDPLPQSLMNVMSGDYGEAYERRIFAFKKLEEETVVNEDRQKRFESFLNVSRYSRTNCERRGSSNTLRSQTAKPLQQRPRSERTTRRVSSPRTSQGNPKIVIAKTKIHNCKNTFNNAKNSHTILLSECQSLTDRQDMPDTASSEEAEGLNSNGRLGLLAPVESKTRKIDKSKVEERPKTAQSIRKGKSVQAVKKKRRVKSTPTQRELKPAKFYDVTEIAATYAVPCDEKIKAAAMKKKQSLAPGKSYFSQRRNSLTKNTTKRPATAVVRNKTLFNRTKRPNTALVYSEKGVAKIT